MALFKLTDILPKEKTKGYVYLQRANKNNALMYADLSSTERVNIAVNAIVKNNDIIEAEQIATIEDIDELREQFNSLLAQVSVGAKIISIELQPEKWEQEEFYWVFKEKIETKKPKSIIIQCIYNQKEYDSIFSCKIESKNIFFFSDYKPINIIKLLVIVTEK